MITDYNGCVDEDMPRKQHDHAHGFVELLRFLIEHLGNRFVCLC